MQCSQWKCRGCVRPYISDLQASKKAAPKSIDPGANTPGGLTDLTGKFERPVTIAVSVNQTAPPILRLGAPLDKTITSRRTAQVADRDIPGQRLLFENGSGFQSIQNIEA
ncbi:MAG: hypothetical protein A2W72_01635 [Burkholderiales bacterium RIFCSPLOWO2_12_67_14]|nr:MAG: hypothetical protein A2W72_01635 [Burkholderiales bacterium RIFCSPLOWO2_12_67_14]OGB76238.1 MAG: hypothetical protein A3G82_11225 [Burkholderiales bacterium RIFCSPLOWO2_12_FULL_67_210]